MWFDYNNYSLAGWDYSCFTVAMHTLLKLIYLTLIAVACCPSLFGVGSSFTTEGNAIRRIVPGTVNAKPVLFLGELDGSVSCYTTNGEQLWRQEAEAPAILFEIEAADLDGDGNDELLVASGNGSISCWGSDGALRWEFHGARKIRFNEVAVLRRGADVKIYAGGNDKVIYVLDAQGKLIAQQEVDGAIRKLEVGDFKKEGEPLLFVMTMRHDKSGWLAFGFYDPNDLKVSVGSLSAKNRPKRMSGIITDLRVQDLDRDGRDDLLVFINSGPVFCAMNGEFEEIAGHDLVGDRKLERLAKQRYAHSTGMSLYPARKEVLLQFGRAFYVLDERGNLLEWSGSSSARFPLADFCLHPVDGKFYGAGSVGGDNAVYEFDLSQSDWWQQHSQCSGRMAQVNGNLQTLYWQVVGFEPPAYQKPSEKPWVMGYGIEVPAEVAALDFNTVIYADEEIWSEDYDRSDIEAVVGPDYAKRRDKRKPYKDTRGDLVRKAQGFEARGEPFIVWAGHGSDPFYVSIGTLEAILQAAPNTCFGFTYAEMGNPEDPRVHYFIDHYMPRLAKACREQGKAKLYFRYKQTFWATAVHSHPWSDLFLSKKYADLLVPGTEDTNSTTQELNLAGRVGMFFSGCVDDFAMRLIDDNPTGWRPLAPGRQKTISPFLRSGVMRAAYGARFGLMWNFRGHDGPGLELLMALMGSGVLPVVERDALASVGSLHLMREVPHELQEREHSLGHKIDAYLEADYQTVFSVTNVHWGGASVPEYDFSKMLGVDYRWLNFMPKLPYGMIPIVPASFEGALAKANVPFSVSNAEYGFVDGKAVAANAYGAELLEAARAGAASLPVLVEGASWSAVWIDESHLRLILVDPYYLDPRDCEVTVSFQRGLPKSAVDILTQEGVAIKKQSMTLTVPAGSMRFVDVEYDESD